MKITTANTDRRGLLAKRLTVHWGSDQAIVMEVYSFARTQSGIGGHLRFDGPTAETPLHALVSIGAPLAVYANASNGRRLNRCLNVQSGQAREIGMRVSKMDLRWHRGWKHLLLEWSLWTDPKHQVLLSNERKNLSRWYQVRRGYVHPIGAVLNAILGKENYATEVVAEDDAVAYLEDGPYPLSLSLERAIWKRPRLPWASASRTTVEYRVKPVSEGGRGFAEDGYKFGHPNGLTASSTPPLTKAQAATPVTWRARP